MTCSMSFLSFAHVLKRVKGHSYALGRHRLVQDNCWWSLSTFVDVGFVLYGFCFGYGVLQSFLFLFFMVASVGSDSMIPGYF